MARCTGAQTPSEWCSAGSRGLAAKKLATENCLLGGGMEFVIGIATFSVHLRRTVDLEPQSVGTRDCCWWRVHHFTLIDNLFLSTSTPSAFPQVSLFHLAGNHERDSNRRRRSTRSKLNMRGSPCNPNAQLSIAARQRHAPRPARRHRNGGLTIVFRLLQLRHTGHVSPGTFGARKLSGHAIVRVPLCLSALLNCWCCAAADNPTARP